jgi:hypothetical protein
MKKVISALTVAAMCASMAASTVPAFAVYKAGDVSTYLKVVEAGKGTVSADGSTVTFASAADAASAKITVAQYLVCDAANPSVQQIGALYTTDTTDIKLGNNGQGVDYSKAVGAAKEYTIGGETFTTDLFVNCFGYLDFLGDYTVGNGNVSWGHSDDWQGDGWVGNGKNDVLLLQWATDFADNMGHPDDYDKTAHFISEKSDDYPLTQFDVNLGASIKDGTYTVDFLESYTHPEYGKKNGNWINVDGKNTIQITDTKGITIKVGDSSVTPTDAPATDPVTTPTDAPATDPVTTPTEPSSSQDISKITDWTWVVEDATYDPAKDKAATINILSAGADPGIFGYDFNITIDGQTADKAGFKVGKISQGTAYNFTTFQPNTKNGHVGATETNKEVTADYKAEAGSTVVSYMLIPPKDVVAGKKYKIEIIDASCGNYNKESLAPKVMSGTLTIAGGEEPSTDPVETTPVETTPVETTPVETTPVETAQEETTPVTPGTVLYGDVNEDGKVELVDVVKLNRYLTGLDAELSATAMINANCFRAAGESDADTKATNLDGKDSMEILKVLIDSIKQSALPTKA